MSLVFPLTYTKHCLNHEHTIFVKYIKYIEVPILHHEHMASIWIAFQTILPQLWDACGVKKVAKL